VIAWEFAFDDGPVVGTAIPIVSQDDDAVAGGRAADDDVAGVVILSPLPSQSRKPLSTRAFAWSGDLDPDVAGFGPLSTVVHGAPMARRSGPAWSKKQGPNAPPRSCDGVGFDLVESATESVAFDLEFIAALEVQPEPFAGAEVSGES